MARRHERTKARRAALQVLYASEMAQMAPWELEDAGAILVAIDEIEGSEGYSDYARRLALGVDAYQHEIDACLDAASDNWRLERMPIVDRSLLRLATFEMLYIDEVPISVSINEAVELAKEFGGEDDSPRFVNGVLGRIAKLCEERSEHALEKIQACGQQVCMGDELQDGGRQIDENGA